MVPPCTAHASSELQVDMEVVLAAVAHLNLVFEY
jgi:hypothetical protein